MNSSKIVGGLLSATLVWALASCSATKGTGKAPVPGTGKTEAVVQAPQQPAQPVQTPQGSENIAGTPVNQSALSGSSMSQLAGKLNGEWVIVEAGKYKISRDDDMPYINFSESDGKFYANNGCNIVNGNFLFNGADKVTFSNIISTRKYCPDVKFDNAINAVLADGNSVTARIEAKGNETYLYLANNAGKSVMTLRKHNLEALNGQWMFSTLEGKKVEVDGVNIFFDIPEQKVHGNTGCNYFNGTITIDSHKPNSISFSQMAVTMRMCENSDTERQMLVALEETSTYSVSGKTLRLFNSKGHEVATLTR